MAQIPTSSLQNPRDRIPDSISSTSDLSIDTFLAGNHRRSDVSSSGGGGGGSTSAKYKSMSPASLPISRSLCFTNPPGLSPTSLLDSPILLADLKVEPSPTTGTFCMTTTMRNTVTSSSMSLSKDTANNNTCKEASTGEFEFKPYITSSSLPSTSSLKHLATSGSNYNQCGLSAQVEDAFQSQRFGTSDLTVQNNKVSSDGLTLSVCSSALLVNVVASKVGVPAEVKSDESQLRRESDGSQSMLSGNNNADQNGPNSLVIVEKSSEDGYNWRKYGQKHVKGSEFPRSYYKCTHPNCPVKKQLERSHDGHITEVIYKGTHDHPKPVPGRRSAVGVAYMNQTGEQCNGFSSILSTEVKSLAHGPQSHRIEPNSNSELSPVSACENDTDGVGARTNNICDDGDEDEDDDPEAKRRKRDIGDVDVTPMIKAIREPRVVVQTLSEVDILDDGYRWRKYGQKVVKGNPNPRSYYKCTNAGCPVRKHVERASHDPKAVITTYEGKHNHDVPSGRIGGHVSAGPVNTNHANALHNQMSVALNRMLGTDDMSEAMPHCFDRTDNGTVSLDLGVGISPNPDNVDQSRTAKHLIQT